MYKRTAVADCSSAECSLTECGLNETVSAVASTLSLLLKCAKEQVIPLL